MPPIRDGTSFIQTVGRHEKEKMKQATYILMIFFLNSCGNSEIINNGTDTKQIMELTAKVDSVLFLENFKRDNKYEPISLNYNGKPILSPGEKVQNLDSTLSFRYDPNGKYWDNFNLIKDHLSLDDNLSIELTEGSINGILFFSSDQIENQIFNISGNWTIGKEITQRNEDEIIKQITERLFPILTDKLKFQEDWKFINEKENYTEYFSVNPPKENGFWWTMDYEVKMK